MDHRLFQVVGFVAVDYMVGSIPLFHPIDSPGLGGSVGFGAVVCRDVIPLGRDPSQTDHLLGILLLQGNRGLEPAMDQNVIPEDSVEGGRPEVVLIGSTQAFKVDDILRELGDHGVDVTFDGMTGLPLVGHPPQTPFLMVTHDALDTVLPCEGDTLRTKRPFVEEVPKGNDGHMKPFTDQPYKFLELDKATVDISDDGKVFHD